MSILSNSQGLLFSQISIEESKEFQATTLQGDAARQVKAG